MLSKVTDADSGDGEIDLRLRTFRTHGGCCNAKELELFRRGLRVGGVSEEDQNGRRRDGGRVVFVWPQGGARDFEPLHIARRDFWVHAFVIRPSIANGPRRASGRIDGVPSQKPLAKWDVRYRGIWSVSTAGSCQECNSGEK